MPIAGTGEEERPEGTGEEQLVEREAPVQGRGGKCRQ